MVNGNANARSAVGRPVVGGRARARSAGACVDADVGEREGEMWLAEGEDDTE